MKKLLLVDDHQIILDGLAKILEEDETIQIVGQVHNGKEALDFLKKEAVDIICMDIEMPVLNGIEVAKVVKQKYPNTKVFILSMYNRPELVKQLAKIGVAGFLKKDAGKNELLLALDFLSKGDTYYSQHFTKSLIESEQKKDQLFKLTSREKEVLDLLSEGKKTGAIAEALIISNHTVQSHRKNLLGKFGVNNTPSLIKEAVKLGYISM